MTKTEFKAKAEAAFYRANPGAKIDEWIGDVANLKYPTGVTGWHGKFKVSQGGYKTTVMIANGDDSYVMVR